MKPELAAEPLPRRIVTGLSKVSVALRHRAQAGAGTRHLTPLQGAILAALHAGPGQRASALAERLAVTLPTISDSVRALVAKRLVERRRDPADARAALLHLTPAGRAEGRRAAGWPDFLAAAVDALSEDEQEVFYTGLVKMIRALQERGDIPVSRMCVTCTHFRPHVRDSATHPHHCAYVDAPLAARELRLDCPEHDPAGDAARDAVWARFTLKGAPR
jgi:DNA-binding MarR family transcriptional regulator